MRIRWMHDALDDLKDISPIILKKLLPKIVQVLQEPESGIITGPHGKSAGSSVRRIKPISGYWITYFYYNGIVEVASVVECKREMIRGSRNANIRIAQIREETKLEFERLDLLLKTGG